MTRDEWFLVAKSLIQDQADVDQKIEFLKRVDEKLVASTLGCFICGLSLEVLEKYYSESQVKDSADVREWMFNEIARNALDYDQVNDSLNEVQKQLNAYIELSKENSDLHKLLEGKMQEIENLKNAATSKDEIIRKLQNEKITNDKARTNVFDQQNKNALETNKSHPKDVALIAFAEEVLNNDSFSREQKNFLLSKLENGEPYSDVRILADSKIPIEFMERYFVLIKNHHKNKELKQEKIKGLFKGGKHIWEK